MTTDLLPLEGSKSAVWNHFGFPAKDGQFVEPDKKKRNLVHCKLCGKRVKYSGNTTNFGVELQWISGLSGYPFLNAASGYVFHT